MCVRGIVGLFELAKARAFQCIFVCVFFYETSMDCRPLYAVFWMGGIQKQCVV